MRHNGGYGGPGGPGELASFGPVVYVRFTLTQPDVDALTAAGQEIPQPIPGFMLVDTGADTTNVIPTIPGALNIPPCGQAMVGGVHGVPQAVNVYRLQMELTVGKKGELHPINFQQTMASIGMDKVLHPEHATRLRRESGLGGTVCGLIGRDFLQHCTFRYSGPDGRFWLEFAQPGSVKALLKKNKEKKRKRKG